MADPVSKKDYPAPAYILVILGACAMTLGCSLAPSFADWLSANFEEVGLMRDGLVQMRTALNGGFNNGVPYDFGSKGLMETMDNGGPPMEDRIFPNMMNVEAPGAMFTAAGMRDMSAHLAKARAAGDWDTSSTVCGNCKAKENKQGGPLLTCSRCMKKKYCSKDCQKVHWNKHKIICEKAVVKGQEGETKGDKSKVDSGVDSA